ncbi:MAG: hypothetical protein RR022_02745 [Angelakisella sp.]
MNEINQFKVVLRGYEREEVDACIRKLKAECQRTLDEKDAELSRLNAQAEDLTAQLQEGEALRNEMQTAMTGAQDFINAQAARGKATERELEDTKKKNALYMDKQEALTRLLAEAQSKCTKLVEEAEQHSQHIVEEAERQKAEILDKAHASAASIIGDSKRDADAVQTQLRNRFATITDTVAAIRQLTGQVSVCCDAADQMIAEPDSFFYNDTEETVTN